MNKKNMTTAIVLTPQKEIKPLGEPSEPREIPPPPLPILFVNHRYAILHLPNQENQEHELHKMTKLFVSTLKDWKSFLEDRVGLLRAQLQTASENKELLTSHFEHDHQMKTGYFELFSHFQDVVKKPRPPTRHIIAYTDDRGLIQGFCDFEAVETKSKTKQVFIHTLFTAPWNLKMHAPVPSTHVPLLTKGVGSKCIREAYLFGQTIGAEYVSLKPLGISESFYRERLHMHERPDEEREGIVFQMAITPELPKELGE